MQNTFSLNQLSNRGHAYIKLIRLDKPTGALLLLWPTLAALWLAHQGIPSTKHLIIFTLGVFVMRSAGCIINDLADRRFDGAVARTHDRPLVTGELGVQQAFALLMGLLLFAGLLVWQLNWHAVMLAPIALVLTSFYPFCKRWTYWPQLVLGLTFNLGILMAFAAAQNQLPLVAWWLYGIGVVWTLTFDTVYAIADRPYDHTIGIKSTAVLFEGRDAHFIIPLQGFILLGLFGLGVYLRLGGFYYLSLLGVMIVFIYQYFQYRSLEMTHCIKAFMSNHWAWGMVLLGLITSLL